MTALASALFRRGAAVFYVAEELLSTERLEMGWSQGDLGEIDLNLIASKSDVKRLLLDLPKDAIHITQGVRSNGLVGAAQTEIKRLGLRHMPIMEKVDLRTPFWRIKSLLYRLKFWQLSESAECILAIGKGTAEWIELRSPRRLRAIEFAYFLDREPLRQPSERNVSHSFIFVGSLVQLKRVDLLLKSLSRLREDADFSLLVIGDGPERPKLEAFAKHQLNGKVIFQGTEEMPKVIDLISRADCLVLPSDQDGWGAVISEALLHGTPVICSSECGASGVVANSGFGSVFSAGEEEELTKALVRSISQGTNTVERRGQIYDWATSLSSSAGAEYMLDIAERVPRGEVVRPPWQET